MFSKVVLLCSRNLIAGIFVLMACGLSAASSAAALPAGCSQNGQTVTCTYTSGSNPFTVPTSVSSIHVVAVGAMGSGSVVCVSTCTRTGVGGHGATVSGEIPVTAGSTLYAVVGTNGGDNPAGTPGGAGGGLPGQTGPVPCSPSFCAGGGFGGGASDVRSSQNELSSRLLVAGGGGGAGGPHLDSVAVGSDGGAAGAAGKDGVAGGGVGAGGGGLAGAGSTGGAGGTGGGVVQCGELCAPGSPGSAGGVGSGGAGGSGGITASFRFETFGGGGGGGGGGWAGGGGGGGSEGGGGGGGGGGSNLVPPGGSQAPDTTGAPLVQISYKLVPTSKSQCMNGGWRNFAQFKTQGDCVSFVVAHHK
jgi:hypothetical protein